MNDGTFSDLSEFSRETASERWLIDRIRIETFFESTELGLTWIDFRRMVRTFEESRNLGKSCFAQ